MVGKLGKALVGSFGPCVLTASKSVQRSFLHCIFLWGAIEIDSIEAIHGVIHHTMLRSHDEFCLTAALAVCCIWHRSELAFPQTTSVD